MRPSPAIFRRRGFTLLELLVVIGIIVVLAAILIPTISHVRTSVHVAGTASRVQAIANAIENYYHAFNAYPGPAADSELLTPVGTQKLLNGNAKGNAAQITGTENLTLALMGGIRVSPIGLNATPDTVTFLPEECGKGALGLNPYKPAQRYGPYIDAKTAGLEPQTGPGTWVKWANPDHARDASVPHQSLFVDTEIPEFVDAFPDAMPILYIRASAGASGSIEGAKDFSSASPTAVLAANAAYDPAQLQLYVFPAIPDTATAQVTPLAIVKNAFPQPTGIDPQVLADFAAASPATSPANYFGQYSAPAKPRHTGYLLITAGPDRKYMTRDDTINNGSAVK